jgi:hypothetical protein
MYRDQKIPLNYFRFLIMTAGMGQDFVLRDSRVTIFSL